MKQEIELAELKAVMRRVKIQNGLKTTHKFNSKWIIDIHVKPKTTNTGESF